MKMETSFGENREISTFVDRTPNSFPDINFFGTEELISISYKQTPETYKKTEQLRKIFAAQGEMPDDGSLALVQQAIRIEEQKEQPELLESVLGMLDIKIKEREYLQKEKPLYELTTDTLKEQESFFEEIVRDFLGEELFRQTEFLERVIKRDSLDMELVADLIESEDRKARMGFDLVGRLIEKQEQNIVRLNNIDTKIQKKAASQKSLYKSFLGTFGHDYLGLLDNIIYLIMNSEESEAEELKLEITSNPRQLRDMVTERLLLIQEPNYKKHTLVDIYTKSINQLNGRLLKKKIELNLGGEEMEVFSDSPRMQVWLYNFLTNATKFTPEGGTIFVSGEKIENGYVRVSVKDNGGGISLEKLEYMQRMFGHEIKPERMTSEIGTEKEKGTGKGLRNCVDLAKNIVGAKLEVESEEGEGATFSFIVPSTEEQHNEILKKEKERVATVTKEVPLLIQGILLNEEKREAGQDEEELQRSVDEVLSGTKFAQKEVV
jgi:signal transduction histidine kinase